MRTFLRAAALLVTLLLTASAAAMPALEHELRTEGTPETCESSEGSQHTSTNGSYSWEQSASESCEHENFGADAAITEEGDSVAEASFSDGGSWGYDARSGSQGTYTEDGRFSTGSSDSSWNQRSGWAAEASAAGTSAGTSNGCVDRYASEGTDDQWWWDGAHGHFGQDSYETSSTCGTRAGANGAELALVGQRCESRYETAYEGGGSDDWSTGESVGSRENWCGYGIYTAGMFAGQGSDCEATTESHETWATPGDRYLLAHHRETQETCDDGLFLRSGDWNIVFVGTRTATTTDCVSTWDGGTNAHACESETTSRDARAQTPVTTATLSLP